MIIEVDDSKQQIANSFEKELIYPERSRRGSQFLDLRKNTRPYTFVIPAKAGIQSYNTEQSESSTLTSQIYLLLSQRGAKR